MKKITLLLLMMPFFSMAQHVWDFNDNTTQGWSALVATPDDALTPNNTNVEFEMGQTGNNSPTFALSLSSSIDADTSGYQYCAVTLKNESPDGPQSLRFGSNNGSLNFSNLNSVKITNSDTDFKTYYIPITNNNHWTGTITEIRLQFKGLDNTPYNTDGETVIIDHIELLVAIPETEKHIFNFDVDGDLEGWSASGTGVSATVSGGNLIFSPASAAGGNISLVEGYFYVNAATANKVTIKVQNQSDNNELRFSIDGEAGVSILPVSTNDATEQTYNFDLTQITDWNSVNTQKKIKIQLKQTGNVPPTGSGQILINSIVFSYDELLSNSILEKKINITLFPNPFVDIIEIQTEEDIKKVVLYNSLGQEVGVFGNTKTLNVSSLTKGIYFAKIYANNKAKITSKIIKN